MEKSGLRKILHARKVPNFYLSEFPCGRETQSAKHLLIKCRIHAEKKNRIGESFKRAFSAIKPNLES